MVIQYRAADNVALGGNMSNAGFGLQVRGVKNNLERDRGDQRSHEPC